MNALHLLKEWWPFIIVAAPGFYAVWKSDRENKRADRKDKADLVKIAQEAAGAVIQSLRDRLDEVEAELAELRKEHTRMIADKDAKITLLEAELRRWKAIATSYERTLAQHDIPHPKPGQMLDEAKAERLFIYQSDPSAEAAP